MIGQWSDCSVGVLSLCMRPIIFYIVTVDMMIAVRQEGWQCHQKHYRLSISEQ